MSHALRHQRSKIARTQRRFPVSISNAPATGGLWSTNPVQLQHAELAASFQHLSEPVVDKLPLPARAFAILFVGVVPWIAIVGLAKLIA